MKKMTMLALTLCLVAGVAVGCALVDAAYNPTPTPDAGENPAPTPPKEEEETGFAATLVLYFADAQAEKVVAEVRDVTVASTLAETIVEELIKGPQSETLLGTIPAGTKLMGLTIEEGIAYVDVSAEMKTNHWGGSASEIMTIQSLVASLTELEDVTAVQLLLEGQTEEAIFGHSCTLDPFEPDANVICR